MRKTNFSRIVAFILAVLTISGTLGINVAAADGGTSEEVTESKYDWGQISDILNAVSYSTYRGRYTSSDLTVPKAESSIFIDVQSDFVSPTYAKQIIEDAKSVAGNTDDASIALVNLSLIFEALNFDVEMIPLETYATENSKPELLSSKLAGADGAIFLPDTGTATWKVNIPSDAMYGVRLIYAQVDDAVASIERMIYVNGEIPFSEARSLTMTKTWKYNYEYDSNGTPYSKSDINGNDLRPTINIADPEWSTYNCVDTNGYTVDEFEFYFHSGENYVSLSALREPMALKSIELYRVDGVQTYKEYQESHKDATIASGSSIKFEAEYPYAVSDTSIYSANDRTSSITTSNYYNNETDEAENKKNSPGAQLLNTIGANSYNSVGQWASYKFTVDKTGLYNIVMRYKQSQLEGMFVSRVLKLSGGEYGDTPTVPFAEAYYTRFNYSKDWQVNPVGNGKTDFEFYFEEGVEYTLYLEVGLGDLSEILGVVEKTITTINNAYLNILKLTGPSPDKYRTYNFIKIMPSTISDLCDCSKTLYGVSQKIQDICGATGSHVVTLDNVARLLNTMGQNPEDEIASNLSSLKSYIGTLGTWMNSSKSQSITVDYITVQGCEEKLPKANANIFQGVWFEIRAFVRSFFVDYNSLGVTEELEGRVTLNVWLSYGRDQSQIWRNLINSSFTDTTGIAVNLKLVAGGTLLPSVLAGEGPDVYIGLDSGTTMNYAIRGAVATLNEFSDIGMMLDGSVFKEAALIPLTLYGEVYGIPETMAFSMMYIREDVLASLKLDIPNTWDDLYAINTILVADNMQIGISYGGTTNQLIYQSGNSIWKYEEEGGIYAGSQTAYGDDEQLAIFTKVCRLYTDYSFPYSFDASNRFRTGELPIFVGDYVGSYNTLVVFATEIKNVWSFYPVPGTEKADGTVDHSTTASVTATIMLHGVKQKQEAWEFMKWQTNAEMQAQYGNEMVALIGPSAKYATANVEAIGNLSWTSKELDRIGDQLDSIAAVAYYPGNYILGRYIQFAFLAAYNEGADPAYAMKSYINTINKEINRKREEFNLPIIEIGGKYVNSLD